MKKLSIALILFYSIAKSQIVYEKGYFVNNNGTKTPCYIENLDWRDNPTSFNYKLQPTDADKKIENIMGVQEFGIDNVSQYKRFTVNIERSAKETGQLTPDKNPKWKVETLFLQTVVSGAANLYVYNEDNLVKYFYETKTTPVEQLVYIRYLTGDGYEISENNQFKQQLYNHVRCSNTPDNSFNNLQYNGKTLSKHFALYNSCSPNSTTENVDFYTKDQDRESFALRVTPGVYSASLDVKDPGTIYNVNTKFNGVVFKFGLEAEYVLPFNKNTWSIFMNPMYQKFTAEKTYANSDGISGSSALVHYTAKADYTSIEVPIGVRRYFFAGKSSKIFINLAYVIDLSLGDSKITFKSAENLVNADQEMPIKSRNNFAAGVGYGYKNLCIELRANVVRELSEYIQWHAKYSSYGVNLGYKFL